MGGIASDSFGGELPVHGLHLWGVGCSWAPAAILCFWGLFMVGSRWAGWGGGGFGIYLPLRVLGLLWPGFDFWGERVGGGLCLHPNQRFSNLKSFCNS